MAIETIPFDAVKYLATPEAQAVFLRDALETGDDEYISHAFTIVRALDPMLEALLPSEVSELGADRGADARRHAVNQPKRRI